MDQQALIRLLMETFLVELEEHVRALNDGILALEKGPSGDDRAEILKTLFRTAHSLKGAARSVNVKQLEAACHSLEDLLAAARDETISLGPGHFGLIYATADAMADAGARLRAKQDLEGAPITTIAGRLAAAARGAAAPPASPSQPVAAPETTAGTTSLPGTAAEVAVVRVPVAKLDAILTRSGDLLLARHRLESRGKTVESLHEFVDAWKDEWCKVEEVAKESAKLDGGAEGTGTGLAERWRRCLPLIDRVGENLRRLERDLERLSGSLAQDRRVLNETAGGLDDQVRRVRMLPFAEACAGLERAARDISREQGKDIEVVVVGGRIELDRSILEGLKDPLLHLVRNAADHGLETPDERRAAGKPPVGRVTVSASVRGSHIEVEVLEDGRGLDLAAIRAKALKKKMAVPQDDAELAQLIFVPGFSTAEFITEVSGRGVGMDVVRSRVESLHGTVAVSSTSGRGTRFTLVLPLTLTTMRALMVRAGGRVFAVDAMAVRRVVAVLPKDTRTVQGADMLLQGAVPVPATSLTRVLGLPDRPLPASGRIPLVILGAGDKQAAFTVEELLDEEEIVVKSLGARLKRVEYVTGATILPSGAVALILNVPDLVRSVLRGGSAGRLVSALSEGGAAARRRVLITDDSVTARTLLKNVLDAAGYDVTVTVDGADAWETLQESGAELVVSDVEMPRMDGFALTQAIRSSGRFADLPVVLVTARSSEQDKARGMEVGANAYLVKSTFDHQVLLDAIAQLL